MRTQGAIPRGLHIARQRTTLRRAISAASSKTRMRIRTAAIAVWPVAAGREQQRVFDAAAVLTPCTEPHAEPGEVEVLLDVRERQ